MASKVFIDSGAFYGLLDHRDQVHAKAKHHLQELEAELTEFITTDYVLDETATLLQTRGLSHVVGPWLEDVLTKPSVRVIWMDPSRFDEVRRFFAKHSDKEWSFTDCFSFCVMKERKMRQALAADMHFRQAGFEPLLAS